MCVYYEYLISFYQSIQFSFHSIQFICKGKTEMMAAECAGGFFFLFRNSKRILHGRKFYCSRLQRIEEEPIN